MGSWRAVFNIFDDIDKKVKWYKEQGPLSIFIRINDCWGVFPIEIPCACADTFRIFSSHSCTAGNLSTCLWWMRSSTELWNMWAAGEGFWFIFWPGFTDFEPLGKTFIIDYNNFLRNFVSWSFILVFKNVWHNISHTPLIFHYLINNFKRAQKLKFNFWLFFPWKTTDKAIQPLSAESLGFLLYFERNYSRWLHVFIIYAN